MSNKMLIDAAHPEETRVVVLRGKKVEEFDFEAAERQQLRGNIYLAKVTRVEPSLQAAFVDYGGNRHGFLAFSEIHPDYYQIPVADRQALIDEQARAAAAEAAEENGETAKQSPPNDADDEQPASDNSNGDNEPEGGQAADSEDQRTAKASSGVEIAERVSEIIQAGENGGPSSGQEPGGSDEPESVENDDANGEQADAVEEVGADDAIEEYQTKRATRIRQYKIQEVIKRRQVLLVQVVKEERGNKGAALTTYLSLAGRYCVLMPNTARGGGISRKITNPGDRKRLKAIAEDLHVADGAGVILRTAGASRTKAEIKRDFEYLLRLWENVRELTLKSAAPTLVYEEGSLIKRSIRDLYSKEIDEILVSGDDGYREAKDFMRMLMPSHARHVHQYKETVPLFANLGVESQLDAMFSPQVTLKSGGYIVINQTEALVAVDVNSGRSTREHSIEDTAVRTNLEAAEEASRQLRLRDLAGLIVIDFIDMEEKRNNRAVEKRLKDCLKADRARIQVGRVSHFGLLEMSRQRIRTGVLESSTEHCPVCRGTGQVRSVSSLALQILRSIDDKLLRDSNRHLEVHTRPDVALYMLNQKRSHLAEIEQRFGLSIQIDGEVPESEDGFTIVQGDKVDEPVEQSPTVEATEEEATETAEPEERKRRKRRRRKRNVADSDAAEAATVSQPAEAASEVEGEDEGAPAEASEGESQPKKRRRRGRRGGRRRTRDRSEESAASSSESEATIELEQASNPDTQGAVEESTTGSDDKPAEAVSDTSAGEPGTEPVVSSIPTGENGEHPASKPSSDDRSEETPESAAPEPGNDEPVAKKSGWWQRRSFL